MPEQGKEALTDFLELNDRRGEGRVTMENFDNQLLAKGLAMQGAGILPPNFDLDTMVEQAGIQLQLEGLLKGH